MDLNLSMVTRPIERLVATAQNGLEVIRLGGLETGSVPSPSQIVESVPMYKLQTVLSAGQPAREAAGRPAGADGAPDDDVGRHVGRHAARTAPSGSCTPAGWIPGSSTSARPTRSRAGCAATLADHIVALNQAIDTVKDATGQDVHLVGYSQGGMWCYQVAAYRRSKNLASIVTFGSPVDTLAALPMGMPANLAPAVADFMADHVFNRLEYPELDGAHRFSDDGPAQDREGAGRLRASAARPRGPVAARAATQVPRVRGMDRLVGPGDLRVAQAVHRPQPDDDRRLRRQRADGHAHRYHLPDTGVHRRGRRHRPTRVRARHSAGGAERRGVRIPHPHRAFRAGGGIEGGQGELADRRRVGAMVVHRR